MDSISQIIKNRFGIHRGLESPYASPNSLNAIKSAIFLEPIFVEFDVIFVDGVIRLSHPPQEPLDELENILNFFNNTNTFPKIDMKLTQEPYVFFVDKLIYMLSQYQRFFLVNIAGIKDRNIIMEAENYFASKIKHIPNIRLNLDLARYRSPKQKIDGNVRSHIINLGKAIHSISLEIYEENWKSVIEFGISCGIKNYHFWLKGWPDVPNPKVKLKTILKALNLEKKFDVFLYFDININHIKKSKIFKNGYTRKNSIYS